MELKNKHRIKFEMRLSKTDHLSFAPCRPPVCSLISLKPLGNGAGKYESVYHRLIRRKPDPSDARVYKRVDCTERKTRTHALKRGVPAFFIAL